MLNYFYLVSVWNVNSKHLVKTCFACNVMPAIKEGHTSARPYHIADGNCVQRADDVRGTGASLTADSAEPNEVNGICTNETLCVPEKAASKTKPLEVHSSLRQDPDSVAEIASKVEEPYQTNDIHRTGAKCVPGGLQDQLLSGAKYHTIGAFRYVSHALPFVFITNRVDVRRNT